MRDYQAGLLKRYGYTSKNGCGEAELCPALSLPDLFRSATRPTTRRAIRGAARRRAAYFSQAVITADRKTATLAFGIKLMPLDAPEAGDRRDAARARPAGGRDARGSPGCRCSARRPTTALSSPLRRLGTLLAGLLAVGLALLLGLPPLGARVGAAGADRARRGLVGARAVRAARAAEPDVGDARRAGDRDLDGVLGAAHRALPRGARGGLAPAEALRRTYASTGAAVVASGTTAIAGFAVLALSDVQMLSDFGRVTVVDLSVSLLGVLAVLPAVLMLAERRARAPRAAAALRPRRA